MSNTGRKFFGVFILFLFSCNSSVFATRRTLYEDTKKDLEEFLQEGNRRGKRCVEEVMNWGPAQVWKFCIKPRFSCKSILKNVICLSGVIGFAIYLAFKLEGAAIKYTEGAKLDAELRQFIERYFEIEKVIREKQMALRALEKIKVDLKIERNVRLALRKLEKERNGIVGKFIKGYLKEVPKSQVYKEIWKQIKLDTKMAIGL